MESELVPKHLLTFNTVTQHIAGIGAFTNRGIFKLCCQRRQIWRRQCRRPPKVLPLAVNCTPGIWLRFLLSFLVVLEALTPLKDRLADAQARVADLRGHL
jgi:hypothetical protein